MVQLSNLERTMDARDHFKNGASSKSQKGGGYKIVEVVFPILVLIGLVMLFMKINIGFIDGKTMLLLTAFTLAAYQDGLIRKMFKQLKEKETIQQTESCSQCGSTI